MKTYPKGTKFGDWSVYEEPQRKKKGYAIRRSVRIPGYTKRKIERLPPKEYRQCANNPVELKKLCIRLNDQVNREEKLRQIVEIKHAYISPIFLDEYKNQLLTQVPSQKKAKSEYTFLVRYFLNFFINKLQMPDPLQWHVHQKTKWAEYLLSNETPSSASTKKEIIRAANRFMIYLHEQRPQEVPPLKFSPLSKARFKQVEAQRLLDGKVKERKYINEKDWEQIQLKLSHFAPSIEPFVLLAYNYGLRRSETMGLETNDVRKDYLYVQRQLVSFEDRKPKFAPLKGRKPRKVPHKWFASPTVARSLIKSADVKLMHPDTLTDLWARYMNDLGLRYDFHDLRHTWISRAIRIKGIQVRDVQLAAGHENFETTNRYLKDDRDFDDDIYVEAS